MDPSQNPNVFHATTIICVRRGDHVAIAGDGQVTLGNTVMKGNARKVRRLGRDGQILAGFAGAAADDVSNYTNRSPYPTLHLLREASIDRAVEAFPDPDIIVERNVKTLDALGHAGWAKLFAE